MSVITLYFVASLIGILMNQFKLIHFTTVWYVLFYFTPLHIILCALFDFWNICIVHLGHWMQYLSYKIILN